MISIVIPSYNSKLMLMMSIMSIQFYTNVPCEIIVVDNGSTDGTCEWCIAQHINCVYVPRREGTAFIHNIGLKIARGDPIILFNHGVLASPNWLSNMINGANSQVDVGIAGPLCHSFISSQLSHVQSGNIEEFQRSVEHLNAPSMEKRQIIQRAGMQCFLLKRELLDKIGYLDEQFTLYYADDDYCQRARAAGYQVMLAGDTVVYDAGADNAMMNSDEREKLRAQNHQQFTAKWGFAPQLDSD